jgi:hypothetical protein
MLNHFYVSFLFTVILLIKFPTFSPINREFYLAKGTEKFIFGWYLLSGILLDNIVEFATLGGLPLAPPYWRIGLQNHIFAIISLSVRDTSI